MLEEQTVIDQISADELGNVSVREARRVLRDGEVIAQTYHRHVVGPKDKLTDEDPRVKSIARAARKGVESTT